MAYLKDFILVLSTSEPKHQIVDNNTHLFTIGCILSIGVYKAGELRIQ
jgi:hypothetical protein